MCCIPEVFGLAKVWLNGSTVRDSLCHVGAHISAQVSQERLLNLAIADNASVSGLESSFVQTGGVSINLFTTGEWGRLWHEVLSTVRAQSLTSGPRGPKTEEQRALAACRKVQLGEVTRARQCLTGAALTLESEATFQETQSKRPQQIQRPLPRRVVECEPNPVQVDRTIFMRSLKSTPKGSSPGWVHE